MPESPPSAKPRWPNRITVNLAPDQAQRLGELADKRQATTSALLRMAVVRLLEENV